MHLTTEQRVLLHLSRFSGKEWRWEAPYEVSQAGISASLHLPQSTISRALKSLKNSGLIEDRVMYIRGEKRKKSAYFVTPAGAEESEKILKSMLTEPVKVKLGDEVKSMSIGEAAKLSREHGMALHPLEIYEKFRKEGVVDISRSGEKYLRFHVPEPSPEFVGREDVIREIKEHMVRCSAIIIKGMAGMGKSALLSEIAFRLSRRCHVFWYSVKKGRGVFELMRMLNEFLRMTGRKPVERRHGARGFFEELRDMNAILIFDDVQFADDETREFLKNLAENAFAEPCNFNIIASTREDIDVFRKIYLARGRVYEIELGPLKKEEIAALFPEDDVEKIYSITGGIPLFVQLYRNAGFRMSDAEKILDEEVFSALSDDEMAVLKAISVHRIPVYPEALGDLNTELLDALRKKLLIFEDQKGRIDMHELLKDMVHRYMSMEERKRMHALAADYYQSPWCDEIDAFEAVHHLCMIGEWKKASELALRLASRLSLEYADPVLFLSKNIDKIPEDMRGEILVLAGDVLSYRSLWEEAMEKYREAVEYLGEIDEIKERMARAEIGMENWEESLRIETELLKEARKRDERHEIARHLIMIGNIYLRSDRPEKAIKSYAEALDMVKAMKYRDAVAVVENNMGSAYIKLGRLEEAEKHILESLKLSRSKGNLRVRALSNLGYLYELKGDGKASEKAYRDAMKIAKDRETLLKLTERLAHLMINDDRWGEAIALAKSSEEKFPENQRWRILQAMADAYRKGRMYEDAIRARIEALQYSDRPDIRLDLAEDMIFAGRLSEALEILEKEEEKTAPWEQKRMIRLLELKGRALSLELKREEAVEAYMEAIRLAEDIGDEETASRLRSIVDGL